MLDLLPGPEVAGELVVLRLALAAAAAAAAAAERAKGEMRTSCRLLSGKDFRSCVYVVVVDGHTCKGSRRQAGRWAGLIDAKTRQDSMALGRIREWKGKGEGW